jgi:hypothetical protein
MKEQEHRRDGHFEGFAPSPAPPWLRSKVLAAAGEAARRGRIVSRIQWGLAAAWGLILVAALVGDAFVSSRFDRALDDALATSTGASPASDPEDRGFLREVFGQDTALERRIQSRPAEISRPAISDWNDKEGDNVY